MTDFPVRYDPEANIISLDGPDGASVMLTALLRAKFGEAFDPLILFHEPLADVMLALQQNCLRPGRPSGPGPFTVEHLHTIAEAILGESYRSGWWDMSREQQAAYLQNVVAAPYSMSDEQIEAVFDGINSGLFNRRRVLEATKRAKV